MKLRIWDIKKNCYMSPFSYGWRFADVLSGEYDDVIKIELWTGCYDKNGKMIYDGDILYCKKEDNVGSVFNASGCFMINGMGTFWEEVTSNKPDILEDQEIIGNINRNPELLK